MERAKMQDIADRLIAVLVVDTAAQLPYMVVRADDNLCSMISIHGSLQNPTEWENGIFHNSPYMIIHISPAGDQRWYIPDQAVTLELGTCGTGMWKKKKLPKYTGEPGKVIQKIINWIKAQKSIYQQEKQK